MKLRTASTAILATTFLASCFAACGDDSETGGTGEPVTITLAATDELFPGFEYSTGLVPAEGKVQASLTVSAKGETNVSAECAVSGSKSKPVLTGLKEGGSIKIDGGFALTGRLKVTDFGFTVEDYDGDIPGLDNIEIPIVGESAFDPFSIGEEVSASAEIPESDLPDIPLGSVPGVLRIHIGKGSTVGIGFTGTCAGIDGEQATYDGTIVRSGELVLEPSIVIEAAGQEFPIELGSFTVDLALGDSTIAASSEVTKFGAAPSGGDKVDASCTASDDDDDGNDDDGSGGAGQGGAGQGGAGQGGAPAGPSVTASGSVTSTATGLGVTTGAGTGCETASDCDGLPCVEGTCSDGTGICESGLSYEDEAADACVTDYCCDDFSACTLGYSDVEGCLDCLDAGGGARCDDYLYCTRANCFGAICDSGMSTGYVEIDECLSTYCCAEFNDCTQNGTEPDACVDCINAGGGALCDAAIGCDISNSCGVF